ncbi:uncharacterized protein LOC119685424 [Teleopsis dalmanni]|uniref:uncharacterized protein LOC119685424 n=1 Tax=Teleopsis dalmanni TaxID=139649 RepID=UPI0018CF24F5|nr:uncharacterized protein LOC119685424 [Teleopsis dalmanni]
MLGTARITIKGNRGTEIECRALLDSGSQFNFITDRLMKKLGENRQRTLACIEDIGQRKQNAQRRVNLTFGSIINNYSARVEAYVIPKIVSNEQSVHIDISNWKIPSNINLADTGFNASDKVDILLGAASMIIVIGRTSDHELPPQTQTCDVLSDDDEILEQVIEKFWKLDAMVPTTMTLTPHKELCESHFVNNTQQTSLGRFVVKLPFKQNPESLGESDQINRFYALERRLSTNETVWQQYMNFMREYENMGHMEKIDIEGSASHYMIPHHCVLRPESSTTKLRVVFDASCKTHNGLSLNDILLTGSKNQYELSSILLRFRCPRLNTVTYGTRSAPYLATKCLQQLAIKESSKYPLAVSAIQNDFYVDDCFSGSDNLNTALEIQRQLKDLLESAGFALRKWCANDPSLLKDIVKQDQEVDLDFDSVDLPSIKTLGIVAIQGISVPSQWRHVSSRHNPADALSRGTKPSQLQTNHLWFLGSMFLHGPGEFKKMLCSLPDNAELKGTLRQVALAAISCSADWVYTVSHRNSFKTLLHIVGYVLRFINRTTQLQKREIHLIELDSKELRDSETHIIRCIQEAEFKEDKKELRHRNQVKATSALAAYTPFLNEDNIIRVGGRLDYFNVESSK